NGAMSKSVTPNHRASKEAGPAAATPDATRDGAAASLAKTGQTPDLNDPGLYLNRELSLLSFQRRVLEEAMDIANPLLERMKFLAILGSNLDEFFMVRVAGLVAQADAGTVDQTPDGMTPRGQLVAIRREVKRLFKEARRCLEGLLPALQEHGIFIHEYSELKETQLRTARKYFEETVFPVLTPLAFDPGRPFPHISNLSLNLAVLIKNPKGGQHFARVKVPDSLPQLVLLNPTRGKPGKSTRKRFDLVWLEQVITGHLSTLFPGMEVVEAHPFHVTRDADFSIQELEAEDLLETIEEGVRQRRFGSVVRLMVTQEMPPYILDILKNNLEVEDRDVYRLAGPLSMKRLMEIYQLDRKELKDPPFAPAVPPALANTADIFSVIRSRNILLHHPFDSFQPVIELLRKSAHDPAVLAIKACLYRVGRNSPVVEALLEAIEEEKQVAALVELKARFDEESNIEWARAMEKAGVHVVYGLVGLKIHCKIALVVRKESGRMVRYVHLSTGNYNAVTAHLYTDIGMFTCDEDIASDATNLFNYLTGYSSKVDYKKLLVAPLNLRQRFESLIEREIEHARQGRKAHLIFKMNALVDLPLIQALYRASQAGVKIQLLVRGICCLRPEVPGVSDHIEVTSIVGRFLEHSRIYYFANGGEEEIYIGSADLMPRNIDGRVEVLFPLDEADLVRRVRDQVLAIYLADNVKARRMLASGAYVRKRGGEGKKRTDAQEWLLEKRRGLTIPPKTKPPRSTMD
ncbi:MAG TPA: polyphosphate kinase 1, partial [Bryobacteraceae bacterium]|nr:polyphosphate kinase 1 [Bryobacteraceae bacterium]